MQSFKIYKFRSMYKNAEDLFEKMQEQNEQTAVFFQLSFLTPAEGLVLRSYGCKQENRNPGEYGKHSSHRRQHAGRD